MIHNLFLHAKILSSTQQFFASIIIVGGPIASLGFFALGSNILLSANFLLVLVEGIFGTRNVLKSYMHYEQLKPIHHTLPSIRIPETFHRSLVSLGYANTQWYELEEAHYESRQCNHYSIEYTKLENSETILNNARDRLNNTQDRVIGELREDVQYYRKELASCIETMRDDIISIQELNDKNRKLNDININLTTIKCKHWRRKYIAYEIQLHDINEQ